MPHFNYIALDRTGRESRGILESASTNEAIRDLKARGLFPTEVRGELKASVAEPARSRTFRPVWRPRIAARERTTFIRQFAALLKAGMPAVRGLDLLARQEGNAALRNLVVEVAAAVRAGDTLHAAFARHPDVFDSLSLGLIRAGESAGALDVVLGRLAQFSEKSLALRSKVLAAMAYPAVVLGVAVTILCGLMVFVVPKFQQIFADLLKGAPLPPLTMAVLTTSQFLRAHWVVALAGGAGCGIAVRWLGSQPFGQRLFQALLVRVPVVGDLLVKSQCVRFTRTLGTLLAGGVPILDALQISQGTAGSVRLRSAIQQIHDRVKAGAAIAGSIEGARAFPPLVASMVDVGEQTGQLTEMLNRVAEIYEDEVDRTSASLSALVEPILIFALAIIVGTIVIALFLPIVRMVQLLS